MKIISISLVSVLICAFGQAADQKDDTAANPPAAPTVTTPVVVPTPVVVAPTPAPAPAVHPIDQLNTTLDTIFDDTKKCMTCVGTTVSEAQKVQGLINGMNTESKDWVSGVHDVQSTIDAINTFVNNPTPKNKQAAKAKLVAFRKISEAESHKNKE